jgi:hypothetical protein
MAAGTQRRVGRVLDGMTLYTRFDDCPTTPIEDARKGLGQRQRDVMELVDAGWTAHSVRGTRVGRTSAVATQRCEMRKDGNRRIVDALVLRAVAQRGLVTVAEEDDGTAGVMGELAGAAHAHATRSKG